MTKSLLVEFSQLSPKGKPTIEVAGDTDATFLFECQKKFVEYTNKITVKEKVNAKAGTKKVHQKKG